MEEKMIIEDTYLKPVHHFAFRHPSGLNGKITGMAFVTPFGLPKRLCYKVSWVDNTVDYVAVTEVRRDGAFIIVDSEGNDIDV